MYTFRLPYIGGEVCPQPCWLVEYSSVVYLTTLYQLYVLYIYIQTVPQLGIMGRENVVGEVTFHFKVLLRHVCQGLSQHRTLKQYSPGILTVLSCDQIIG